MSRLLNVASVLLVVIGIWNAVTGIMALFLPEWMIEMSGMITVSQIRALNQNVLNEMIFTNQLLGLCALSAGLFICVISLIPYRKGEKWAWYTMLVAGGVIIGTGMLVLWTYNEAVPLVFIILWIVGLALPAKEIHSK